MNWFWDIVGVAGAPFTYGASLVLSPSARNFVKDTLSGNDDGNNRRDNTQNIQVLQEQWKVQNEQWKSLMEQNRAEVEKIRQERTKAEKQIKQNEETVASLKNKLNDPNISVEEKERIKKQIIVLEEDNRKLKQEVERKKKEEQKKEKEKPTPPQTPVPSPFTPKLPKLSSYDKMLIAGIMVLIIYFLFLRDSKDRR